MRTAVNRPFLLWLVALAITLLAARYQRVTGPTYPIHGTATLAAKTFQYRLERTHAGAGDHRVRIDTAINGVEGVLESRPLAGGEWASQPMTSVAGSVEGTIAHQPMATKMAYRVQLRILDQQITLPPQAPAVIRFRGDVPWWVLIPHILAMFAAMLYSTRAGLETLSPQPKFEMLTYRTLAALVFGGIILGCLVSWYAFREPWGGFPISNDPTDNKTLLALIVWVAAALALRLGRKPKPWILLASVVLLAVYTIPHSVSMPK
jgi:hypothetical protein